MNEQAYIRTVRDLYLRMTHHGFSRSDRRLAADLYRRHIPIEVVRSALFLATARRICRNPAASPLTPVRSLHYFLHIIDEIAAQPLPQGYVEYLEYKIAQHK
jgi:hypothetical protein